MSSSGVFLRVCPNSERKRVYKLQEGLSKRGVLAEIAKNIKGTNAVKSTFVPFAFYSFSTR